MPRPSEELAKPAKVLFMAKSGFGKTGACAALANYGYKVVHRDFDQGTRIINSYLTDEGRERYWVRHYSDKMKSTGVFIRPDGTPRAWADFVLELKGFEEQGTPPPEWKWEHGDDWYKFPSIEEMDETWVNVFDSFTFMGAAAMRYRLRMNIGLDDTDEAVNRWMHPYPVDYGEAQDLLQNFLALMYSESIRSNILVLTHVAYQGGGGTQTITDKKTGNITTREMDSESAGEAVPTAIGRKLSPIMPRFFNTVISGEFEGRDRVIVTRDLPRFPLKNESPLTVDQRLPISTGLAELFREIRGA